MSLADFTIFEPNAAEPGQIAVFDATTKPVVSCSVPDILPVSEPTVPACIYGVAPERTSVAAAGDEVTDEGPADLAFRAKSDLLHALHDRGSP